MAAQTIFEKTLSDHHYSLTRPRQAVFNALQYHRSLTMVELVAACPGVNRASVYRTTEIFEKLGVVSRIPNGWKHRFELGEAFHEHHHHATCTSCGASIALPEDEALEKRLHDIASRRNFILTSHQIELHGQCSNCQLSDFYGQSTYR